MATYAWPSDLRPSSASLYLRAGTTRFESPLAPAVQVIQTTAAIWQASLSFDRRSRADSARLDAFIAKLRGGVNEVTFADFRRPRLAAAGNYAGAGSILVTGTLGETGTLNERGIWSGLPAAPRVAEAVAAGASSFRAWGFAANSVAFEPGDYCNIQGYLYMAVEQAPTNAGGACVVQVEPPLRRNYAVDAVISVGTQALGRWRLSSDDAGRNETAAPFFSSYALTFVESLP